MSNGIVHIFQLYSTKDKIQVLPFQRCVNINANRIPFYSSSSFLGILSSSVPHFCLGQVAMAIFLSIHSTLLLCVFMLSPLTSVSLHLAAAHLFLLLHSPIP